MNAKPKRSLLVTLADEKYLDHAKQLFSSVYWNAGWQGDYLLLAHSVPEEKLAWFHEKRILVRRVAPLSGSVVGLGAHPACVASKFYLFQTYFKQWEKVVFLDTDIIVRASLEDLASVRGFAAPNAHGIRFSGEFYPADKELWRQFVSEYSLRGPAVNSGILAFSTDIIQPDTFDRLVALFRKYGTLNACGEEGTFNLFFKDSLQVLSKIYNMYPAYVHTEYLVPYESMRAAIVHFVISIKPWDPSCPLHAEWLGNYNKADAIDLRAPQKPKAVWTETQARAYELHLALRRWILLGHRTYFRMMVRITDRLIGKIGQAIRSVSPRAYILLKPKWKLPITPRSAEHALFWADVSRKNLGIDMGTLELAAIIRAVDRPMNLLVFGLGADSVLWAELNRGRTFFIEDKPELFKLITGKYSFIQACLVTYGTLRTEWKSLLDKPARLDMELPVSVTSTAWDMIIVDGPSGYMNSTPGRMKSIYWASKLVKKGGSIFVHDAEREVERAYCDKYLKDTDLVDEVKGRALLRHYRMP